MAYQPKSYRKFVATAATATLVATAVTPAFAATFTDVSDRYKEAVDYVVNNGIAQGTTETQFGVALEIKRVDAAIMLAKALGLNTETAPASGFTDVPERGQGAVNALKAAGIVNGKDADTFGAADQLTRGEMALILAKAYNLTGTATHTFTDIAPRYEAAVQALVAADVTQGKSPNQFGTADAIKRGEFAIFVYKLEKTPVVAPAVTAVSATGARTLEFTGTNLQNLKAENITVAGNSVASVTANSDGTKATVRLTGNLVPNQELQVSTTINGETKEFTTTFEYAVNSVSVENGTFDNDTPDQEVSLLVNGEKADYDYLELNGYTVRFQAFNEDDEPVDIFVDGDASSNTSSTGELIADFEELLNGLASEEFHVEATVYKDGSIQISERATITVTNLDSAASTISDFELTNTTGAFIQNSSTLVVGDVADFTELTVSAGSSDTDVDSGYTVTSSNEGVVSVDDDGVLYAEAPGTAKITIKYGTLTKEVNVTVAAKAREVAKVTAKTSPVKLLTNGERTVEVTVTDQYGDPFLTGADVILTAPAKFVEGVELSAIDDEGKADLTVTTTGELGKGSVFFKDEDDKVLGSLAFETTKVNNVAKRVLEITEDSDSDDLTIDLNDTDDASVEFELVNYTSENVKNGVESDYEIRKASNDLLLTDSEGNEITDGVPAEGKFTVTATEKGSYDVAIYKDDKYVTKVTVKVLDNTPKITKVNWTTVGTVNYTGETLNFEDVLNTTESTNDDIVNGVTVAPSTVGQVRINDSEDTGKLYVDKNSNGLLDDGEVVLGELVVRASANSNFTADAGVIDGVTTAADNEGTLIFSIVDEDEEVIASTSVKVDVPAE